MKRRQERIIFLNRLNRGRKAIPLLRAGLSEILNLPSETFSLLSLEESDKLSETFKTGYELARTEQASLTYRRLFSRAEKSQVFPFIDRLACEIASEPIWFLPSRFLEECGAVKLDLKMMLMNAESLMAFDRYNHSVCALSQDCTQGLIIDYSFDDPDPYECTLWGDRWSVSALLA